MASVGVPQVARTWDDYSFETQTFDYQWTIRNISARLALDPPIILTSPSFSPEFKVNGYKTKWHMSFDHKNTSTPSSISLQLSMVYEDASYAYTPKTGADIGLWAVIKFCVLKPNPAVECDDEVIDNITPNYKELYVRYVPARYHESDILTHTVNVKYKTDIGDPHFAHLDTDFVKNATCNDSLTLYCKVNTYMLRDPKHKVMAPLAPVVNVPVFDLGRKMEEARKSNLFTDAVLVAERREFKVHRAVLASQSLVFKARFEQDLLLRDKRYMIKLDLKANIVEAMVTFMYTGNALNIEMKLALQLLPAAEQYMIIGLRELCERILIESLDAQKVIEYIILAHAHNASQLKTACLSYVAGNPSDVQKSEGWKKLNTGRKTEGLKMEILEAIAKSFVQ